MKEKDWNLKIYIYAKYLWIIYAKIYIALIYIAILCPPLADIKIYSYLLFIADRLILDEGGGGRGIKWN